MFEQLRQTVTRTGLWDNGRANGNHRFVLSPQPFEITHHQASELHALARALRQCLLAISRCYAIGADSNLTDDKGPYTRLYQSLSVGAPYKLGTLRPSNLPQTFKLDLMVDGAGQFQIAEIDTTNPRSWGYSHLGRLLVTVTNPDAATLPGVIPALAAFLNSKQASQVTFLYGDTQRFYAPEFAIVAAELATYGICMQVLNETEVEDPASLGPWLIDLPRLSVNKPLIDYLTSNERAGQINFVVPPKHNLSSKALLAFLSNAAGDPRVEGMLQAHIPAGALELVRRYLPATYLVDKALPKEEIVRLTTDQAKVIKEVASSGAKGVWLPGTPGYAEAAALATTRPGTHILQEPVDQCLFRWQTFDAQGRTHTHDDWRVRLTGYVGHRGMLDLAVTACRTPTVHGGPEAILTGTIVV